MDYNYTDFPGLGKFWDNIRNYYSNTFAPGTNAVADKWATPRTLKISDNSPYTADLPDRTLGSVTFDGSEDFAFKIKIFDDSHDHTLAHVTDLNEAMVLSHHPDTGAVDGLTFKVDSTFIENLYAKTPASGLSDNQVATTAFVQAEIARILELDGSMHFRGVCEYNAGVTVDFFDAFLINYKQGKYYNYKAGDQYVVIVDNPTGVVNPTFTTLGHKVETGDIILCTSTKNAEIGPLAADWVVIQSNKDGVVIGPNGARDDYIATFDGNTGRLIKDSGISESQVQNYFALNEKIRNTINALKTYYGAYSGDYRHTSAVDVNRNNSILDSGNVSSGKDVIITPNISNGTWDIDLSCFAKYATVMEISHALSVRLDLVESKSVDKDYIDEENLKQIDLVYAACSFENGLADVNGNAKSYITYYLRTGAGTTVDPYYYEPISGLIIGESDVTEYFAVTGKGYVADYGLPRHAFIEEADIETLFAGEIPHIRPTILPVE